MDVGSSRHIGPSLVVSESLSSTIELRWEGPTCSTWHCVGLVVQGVQNEHEPQCLPRLVLEWRHHHGGPEARAVLANAPTVHLYSSLAGAIEVALGFTGRTGVGRVKRGDV